MAAVFAAQPGCTRPPLIRTFAGHTDGVDVAVGTPEGVGPSSASVDRTLWVWHLENGKCLRILMQNLEREISLKWNCESPN